MFLKSNISLVNATFFIVGVIGIVCVVVMDIQSIERTSFEEDVPRFTSYYLLRSFILLLSCVGILKGVLGVRTNHNISNIIVTENQQRTVMLVLAIAVVVLLIFMIDSELFSRLSYEDDIVEWSSVLFLFAASLIGLYHGCKYRHSILIKSTFFIFSFCLFVVGMEEVSWFQRVFEIDTPELFDENIQGELNFHNFYTDIIENIYYTGAFFFLVFLPFLRLFSSFVYTNSYLNLFIPRIYISVLGSVACAYNYDMWNIALTQIVFFCSIILLVFYMRYCQSKSGKLTVFLTLIVCVESQFLFLYFGDSFAREWDVTEYKEFFIPLTFFIYFLGIKDQIKNTVELSAIRP